MKVIMGIRGDATTVPGGDVVQMEKTAVELRRLGCVVQCYFGKLGDVGDADILHVFNTTRVSETYDMVRHAQSARLPVVVSPIWHSMKEMRRAYSEIYGFRYFPIWTYSAVKELYYARRAGVSWDLRMMLAYRSRIQHVVRTVDAVLPNSAAELAALSMETDCTPRASWIVPNGFDLQLATTIPWEDRRQIVCAGRIEPRKNQVRLARAFRDARLPWEAQLRLYGASLDQARGYLSRLEKELVAGRSEYGGKLPQAELYAQYGRARVTVLASFFETTGLSALEGLAHGASVVISDSPCTREYFGDTVYYCDPYSERSIATAIEKAWSNPPRETSALLRRFNWAEAGRVTKAAYEHVLEAHRADAKR